jgi:dolichol-phosphate mannosyltransferase
MRIFATQQSNKEAKSGDRMSMVLLIVQSIFAFRVIARMIRTRNGLRIQPVADQTSGTPSVTILVPVLDEEKRLLPCLEGLIQQGDSVAQIIVIDGGSRDGTQELVDMVMERDDRVRLVSAPAAPSELNGKAWQLAYGAAQIGEQIKWVLTIDADVRPSPHLVDSLLAHAAEFDVQALSVATRQRLQGAAEGLIHPSMLTTLVYRFGIPGHATNRVGQVQANGQCFLIRRKLLHAVGGFSAVTESLNEDVTLARLMARHGEPVGFYEAGDLVSVMMYDSARETWQNWPRSLPLRDALTRWSSLIGLAEVSLVQALPLLAAPISGVRRGWNDPLTTLNLGLMATRFGVLAGTARAYESRPWTYWLSPLCDLAVAGRLLQSAFTRTQQWRGRLVTRGE